MLTLQWLLGLLFIVSGVLHFARTGIYMKIMPPYLPWHRELVYLSGLIELILGVLVLIPRFSSLAAWGLIALLIAIFPANVHMAVHAELFPRIRPILLWLRLPFQGVFIAWAYYFT